MTSGRACALFCILGAFSLTQAHAQNAPAVAPSDVGTLSLEQLADIEITSVSRRAESLGATAASAFVISAEDIRRSGATSLAETLRLAPNLEVARINGFSYTVTARGFNSPESANKLLVLVDGRSVYSPLASSVFWESVDVPLSTIERIEVVSGTGGTLYGANAVNGVISVVTKKASDMPGPRLEGNAGSDDKGGTLSYGADLGDGGALRLYATGGLTDGTRPVTPNPALHTGWSRAQGGFRLDKTLGADDAFTLQGDVFYNETPDMTLEQARGHNITGRWTHQLGDISSVTVETYYDQNARLTPFANDYLSTFNVQAQHNTSLGLRDTFAWGGEYRHWDETFTTPGGFGFAQPSSTISLGSLFAQDEFALASDLRMTLGLKGEYNSYSGIDILPSARLAWQAAPGALIWGSVSRAVRTPSKIDRELEAPGILVPAPDFSSEKLIAFELGYRGQITPRLSLSASVYYNLYDDVRSTESLANNLTLPVILRNNYAGGTYGAEIWGAYSVFDWWRVSAGFNWLRRELSIAPGRVDLSRGQSLGQDPDIQAQLRSQMNPLPDWEFDAGLRMVAPVRNAVVHAPALVPGYAEADARLGWHITRDLELSVNGRNLLHARHLEANDPSQYPPEYIGRSVLFTLRASL